VELDGVRRNSEQPRHLLVGHAIAESAKHFDLARRRKARRAGLPAARPVELVHRSIQQRQLSQSARIAQRFAGLASDSGDPVNLMMADRLLATA